MARSKWKPIFYNLKTFKSTEVISSNLIPTKNENKKNTHFIWLRNSKIPQFFVGKRIAVHYGLKYHSFKVNIDMINHKFGEFAITKKLGPKIHKEIILKKKKK